MNAFSSNARNGNDATALQPLATTSSPSTSNAAQHHQLGTDASFTFATNSTEAASTRNQLNAVSVEDSDALFAKEFSQLTTKERDQVLYDIHGVADLIQENKSPDFIPQQCDLLRVEIDRQVQKASRSTSTTKPTRGRDSPCDGTSGASDFGTYEWNVPVDSKHATYAFQLACQIDASYVTSQSFLLLFLRSEAFDVSRAASRLFGFLRAKLDLFGVHCLCRSVRYSDLTDEDRATLRSGYLQLLPGRDRAGRVILVIFPGIRGKQQHTNANLRAIYYITMAALEDVSTQQRGIVTIAYNVANRSIDHVAAWKNGRLFGYLPYRLVALHYCYDNANLRLLLSLTMFDKHTRTRFRPHFGTHMECIYKLMTFGISDAILPVNADGIINLNSHHMWCDHRELTDAHYDAEENAAGPSMQSATSTQTRGRAGAGAQTAISFSTICGTTSESNMQTPLNLANMRNNLPHVDQSLADPVTSMMSALPMQQQAEQLQLQQNIISGTILNGQTKSMVMGSITQSNLVGAAGAEAQTKEGSRVVVPGTNDVLLGRGRPFQEHPGNLRYSHLIETNRQKYDMSKKLEKTALTKEIVQVVKASGGRFLKQDGASWVVVSDSAARDKISHGFRNRRAVVSAQNKRQQEKQKQLMLQHQDPAVKMPNSTDSAAPMSSSASVASNSSNNTPNSLSGSKRMPNNVRVDMDTYLQTFAEEDQSAGQRTARDFFTGIQQFFGNGFGAPTSSSSSMQSQQMGLPPVSTTSAPDSKRFRRDTSTPTMSASPATRNGEGMVAFGNHSGNLTNNSAEGDDGSATFRYLTDEQPKMTIPNTYLSGNSNEAEVPNQFTSNPFS